MIEPLHDGPGKILGFKISETLNDADYQAFVPQIEASVQACGKIRLLALFQDFHGWDFHAIWDDTLFAARHCADIERIAFVGDQPWERWMSAVCRPFTRATVKYFDSAEFVDACRWLADEP